MGLLDAFTAVQNRVTPVLTALGQTVPEYLVGADQLMRQGAPPRVVWEPVSEIIMGPDSQGGDGVSQPRQLATRLATVRAHVWCATIPACEVLANHLVAAMHDVAHGAERPSRGDWTQGQSSANRDGFVFVLEWELKLPFTREPDTFADVHSMPITPLVQTS